MVNSNGIIFGRNCSWKAIYSYTHRQILNAWNLTLPLNTAERSKVYHSSPPILTPTQSWTICSLFWARDIQKPPDYLRNLWTGYATSNHSYTPLSEPLINRSGPVDRGSGDEREIREKPRTNKRRGGSTDVYRIVGNNNWKVY